MRIKFLAQPTVLFGIALALVLLWSGGFTLRSIKELQAQVTSTTPSSSPIEGTPSEAASATAPAPVDGRAPAVMNSNLGLVVIALVMVLIVIAGVVRNSRH